MQGLFRILFFIGFFYEKEYCISESIVLTLHEISSIENVLLQTISVQVFKLILSVN